MGYYAACRRKDKKGIKSKTLIASILEDGNEINLELGATKETSQVGVPEMKIYKQRMRIKRIIERIWQRK